MSLSHDYFDESYEIDHILGYYQLQTRYRDMIWKEATSDSSAPDHETMRAGGQHKSCRSSMHISEKYVAASKEFIMSRTHQQSADSSCGPLTGGDEAWPGSTNNSVQELATASLQAARGTGGGRQLSSPEELRSPNYNLSSESATELPSRVITSTTKKTRRRGDESSSVDPKSCVEMSPTKIQKTMEAPPPLKLDMDPPLRKARVSVRARSDAATVSDGFFFL